MPKGCAKTVQKLWRLLGKPTRVIHNRFFCWHGCGQTPFFPPGFLARFTCLFPHGIFGFTSVYQQLYTFYTRPTKTTTNYIKELYL